MSGTKSDTSKSVKMLKIDVSVTYRSSFGKSSVTSLKN